MGHLIKLDLPRVGNLTGKFVPMVGRFECAEWKTGTNFVLQHVSEYQVSVFSQRFLIENCLDWLVVCSYLSRIFEKRLNKAQPLFAKNPAQHFANLVENEDAVRPAFVNCNTDDNKDIECIRVGGGADEGLVHEEVQYWWTRRHLETKGLTTLETVVQASETA